MKTDDIKDGERYPSRIGGADFYVHQLHRSHTGAVNAVSFSRVDDNAMRHVTPEDFAGMAGEADEGGRRIGSASHVLIPTQCSDDVIAAIVAAMPRLTSEHVATVYAKLVRAAGIAFKDSPLTLPGESVEFLDPLGDFLREVYDEAHRAAALFPGDTLRTLAFSEEAGELVKAVLDESPERVRREAVQTAAMAARIVLDGDGSVVEWRKAKGLAPL